ncbi:MAG: hypothetical protein KDA71_21045, partial [Planctomycetales bacterium]|nr:hypothetical protein [Planctomycetales bacterium]
LVHDRYPDERGTRQMAEQIYDWTGVELPWVRADWFVATASRPPLYHTLLYDVVFEDLARKPRVDVKLADGSISREPAMTAADLERWLRVNVAANLRRNRAARAGFTKSGVSSQPRLIERHPALYGAYWLSYDFKRGNSTMNLLARPLGPPAQFNDPRFQPYHFRQDGGEIIFHLPNGLQGYLLVDGEGNRIHEGPPDVVEDSAKTLGNAVIVNGLSCMACHKQGMRREFEDQVRFGAKGLSSDARDRVRRLYLDPPDMKRLVDKDEARFLAAVEEACGPFLRHGLEDRRATGELDEPVGPVAKRFLGEELGLVEIAAELEVAPADLAGAIRFIPALRESGLAGLADGAQIKRETWESGR